MRPFDAWMAGAASGLVGSFLLSVLARVLPGMRTAPRARSAVPTDREAIRLWQDRLRAPAAFRTVAHEGHGRSAPAVTPAGALVWPEAPGAEGLAEQFAFKVGSGLFDRDVAARSRALGVVTHFAYGSLWGALYGIVQATHDLPPVLAGAVFGLIVWLVGPCWLVPAMKLMARPSDEARIRTVMLFLGHLVYGLAVAALFAWLDTLERR
jgi:hypothetical protein